MPWLLLLLAGGALALAFTATSMAMAIIGLLVALALMVAGTMGLVARRIGNRTRDEMSMIDPEELRVLREQAQARRNAAQSADTPHSP